MVEMADRPAPIAASGRPVLRGRPSDGVTGVLVRGARALPNWSITDLAAAAGVSGSSVKRFDEDGARATRGRTRDAMRAALGAAGIRFITDAEGWRAPFSAPAPQNRGDAGRRAGAHRADRGGGPPCARRGVHG